VVPRLRRSSIYDARVRETCYTGYTSELDGSYSQEPADRQAYTLDAYAALIPYGLYTSDIGPYSFTVRWTPGDPKDCVFSWWSVEINSENYTDGKWEESHECGRIPRSQAYCEITEIHGRSHLRSNTEYMVRLTEVCDTYTSVYDPRGKIRAPWLDSSTLYLPSNLLPRTLIPIPATTPTGLRVSESRYDSFRLSWPRSCKRLPLPELDCGDQPPEPLRR